MHIINRNKNDYNIILHQFIDLELTLIMNFHKNIDLYSGIQLYNKYSCVICLSTNCGHVTNLF